LLCSGSRKEAVDYCSFLTLSPRERRGRGHFPKGESSKEVLLFLSGGGRGEKKKGGVATARE